RIQAIRMALKTGQFLTPSQVPQLDRSVVPAGRGQAFAIRCERQGDDHRCMPLEDGLLLTLRQVPQARRPIPGTGSQLLAIRGKCQAPHPHRVPIETAPWLAGGGIPESQFGDDLSLMWSS